MQKVLVCTVILCYNVAMQTETLPQQKIEVGSMVIVGLTAYYVEEVWQSENSIMGIDQDGHEEEIHMSRIDAISN